MTTYNASHAPPPRQTITVGAVARRPLSDSLPAPRTRPSRPTAAETLHDSADAAHHRVAPLARGPQRPAPVPGEPDEAGLGVTPRCDYCADGLCGGHHATGVTPELRITADRETHPYLIQIHRGGRLLAYAIRDAYGWAITAMVREVRIDRAWRPPRGTAENRIRTVARAHQRWGVEAALLQCAVLGYVPGGLEAPR